MRERKVWKDAKRVLALVLAFALFWSSWSGYDISLKAAGEIPKLEVTLNSSETEYTGSEIKFPEVTVKAYVENSDGSNTEKTELTANTDYSISWLKGSNYSSIATSIKDVGTYRCLVQGKSTVYSQSTQYADFTVNARSLTDNSPTITLSKNGTAIEGNSVIYTGNEKDITVTVKDDLGNVLQENTDYTLSWAKDSAEVTEIKDCGTYTATITGQGNYTGTATATLTVAYGTSENYYVEPESTLVLRTETEPAVYPGSVELKAKDGYGISTEPGGDFGESVTITQNDTSPKKIYTQNRSTNEISENEFSFKIDDTTPEISEVKVSDENAWTQSKTVTVTSTGATYGLYYSVGENSTLKGLEESNQVIAHPDQLQNLTQIESDNSGSSFVVNDEIGENGKSYYIYAVSNGGHFTKKEVTVSKIDTTAPTLTISCPDHFDDTYYWKNSEALKLNVTVQENGSGFTDSSALKITSGNNYYYTTPLKNAGENWTKEISLTKALTYSIEVTDQAGNTASQYITVKQDTDTPSVSIGDLEPETDKKEYHNRNLKTVIWWTNGDSLTAPLTVSEEPADSASEQSPYILKVSKNQDMSGAETIDTDNGEATYSCAVSEETTKQNGYETYYFQVTDYAGNKSNVQSVNVACDKTAPTITSITFPQDKNGDGWLNTAELKTEENSNGLVGLDVKAADGENSVGINVIGIAYSIDGGTNWKRISDSKEDNGVYSIATQENEDSRSYNWEVKVTDLLGNEAELAPGTQAQVDTTAPETTAYIKFATDAAGENDEDVGTKTDSSWTSKIRNLVTTTWNKIWGKNTVEFELYLQDATSGMDGVTLTYEGDGKETTLSTAEKTLTKVEGLKAFREGDADATEIQSQDPAEGYTVYKGKITVGSEETLKISDFQITSMTDVAGNKQTKALIEGGGNFIYLDAVAPKLTEVSVDGNSVAEKEIYFYQDQIQVKLAIEERFFKDGATKPTVLLSKKASTDSTFPDGEEQEQNWTKENGDVYTTYVTLPAGEAEEIEYQIQLAYSDPSGNVLEGAANINGVTDGIYTGKTIVIDNRAPQLLDYSVVNESTGYAFDDADVYENQEGDDLTVSFILDDNASYIDKEGAKLLVEVYEKSENGNADTLMASSNKDADVETLDVERTPKSSGSGNRSFEYTFGFDGTETCENAYYVKLSYQDAAGNLLTAYDFTIEEGTYTSESYILDHVAPKIDITFNEAYQVTDGDSKTISEKQPKAGDGYTAYYGAAEGKVELTVKITEKYLMLEDNGEAADYLLTVNGEKQDMTFTKSGNIYTGVLTLEEEGDYYVSISYQDTAKNKMTAGDTVEGGIVTDGKYTSSKLILDTTAPALTTAYSVDAVNQNGARKYYNEDTVLSVLVKDQNIRYKELKDVLATMTATDIDGAAIDGTKAQSVIEAIDEYGTARGSWQVDLPLSDEANYTFPIAYTDLAGNRTEIDSELATVDKTEPSLEFSYSIKDPINYLPFGWFFSKEKMTITASSKDATAGIQYIIFTVTDENGKVTTKTKEVKPAASGSYEVTIPLETSDFKGTVKAEVRDWSTNSTSQTRNHVVEESGRHAGSGSATVTTITKPSRTVKGVDYYNTDVAFRLTLQDSYSGLRNWKYTAGSKLSGTKDYAAEAGTDLSAAPTKNVTYKYEEEMTLTGKDNDQNDVQVLASYTDNTGRTGQVEQKYNIDITKPTIQVEYDLNSPINGRYYNQVRTATVTITERNFDPADVEFKITNTDGKMPSISSWSTSGSGNDTKHVCKVVFSDDGDYTFTLSFQDLAGNKADYTRKDDFTIDRTKPEYTVTWDNNSYLNGYYYAQARTATIDVLEHNFDAALVNVLITAAGDATGKPALSGWTTNGDHHIARVTFSADGDYTFDIEGKDLADNLFADYETEHFVVDQTAPELEIFDIENYSANNDVVRPGIRYRDTNNDVNGASISMKGFKNGIVEMNGSRTQTANGMELKLNDFAHTQDMDDMYTMEASVTDLAGNTSEDSVVFSVNRFGSVYTFDEDTDKLVGENGKYYTNEAQDLVVMETNVDTLEFKEITNNRNGQLVTMEEGTDYQVQESGSEVSWKQYTYTLDKENFEEEGTYLLTIYSEDRATNTSDNNTKGKKIEFVMDKTSPSILISGVENNGQYRENERKVTLDIEDNVRLKEVKVTIDGQETTYSAADVEKGDGKLIVTAGSANHWQTMSVTAYDAAGNEKTTEEIRFLITSNLLVQFYMNKPLFYGVCAGVLVLGGGLIWFVIAKRKKKEEEEEQAKG